MSTNLEFWRELLDWLFPRGERVLVHEIDLFDEGPSARQSRSLTIEDAVDFVRERKTHPNLYFSPAVFNQTGDSKARSCLRVRGLGFDLDFGTVGHERPSFFETEVEALHYIRSLPLQPSVIWQTGHGLQGFYLFKVPHSLVTARGHSDAQKLGTYRTAAAELRSILHSDVACGPERPFRIPGTLNLKPGCLQVQGRVLRPHFGPTYSWSELRDWLFAHGLDSRQSPMESGESATADLGDLPEELAEDLTTSYEEGTRSEAFHSQVGRLYVRGYDLPTVLQFMEQYSTVGDEKYGRRLPKEVERSFASWEEYTPVTRSRSAPNPLRFLERTPVRTRLHECGSLSQEFEAVLQRYEQQICERSRSAGTRQVARFLENVYHPGAKFIADLPCGSGKSTWSLCHMATYAGPDHQYVYVCRTLRDLFRAADDLQRLRPDLHVGRYHGFNQEECRRLCGQQHTWLQCSPNNRRRVCRTCRARTECSYFTRKEQLKADVVFMAHAAFIDLLADPASTFLRDRSVIVDEDPSAFHELSFTSNELRGVELYLRLNCQGESTGPVLELFKGTRVALDEFKPSRVRTTYGEQYYAHSNIRPLAYRPVAKLIGRCIWRPARWKIPPYWGRYQDSIPPERAREILSSVLQFFRPAIQQSMDYVIHERASNGGFHYVLRRQQGLSPGSVRCRRLVMHNASALLSKQPHAETLPIHTCPDVSRRGQLVTLHVVQANPRKSRTEQNTETMLRLLRRRTFQRHRRILVAVASSMPQAERDRLMVRLRTIWPDPVVRLRMVGRGELRGTNAHGDCTLVLLASTSLFTTVDDLVLTEALRSGRSIPVADVFSVKGTGGPKMTRGCFDAPSFQELYTQQALDEMYQALFRGAARMDQPVDVVTALPSALWLRALWMTVLPGFNLGSAYRWQEDGTLKPDLHMRGFMNLVRRPEGFEIGKREAAQKLGYRGPNAWSDNVGKLRHLLQPFYEELNQRVLRRTAHHPCTEGT